MTAEELSGNDDYVELSFSARKLDDKVCAVACALSKALRMRALPLDMRGINLQRYEFVCAHCQAGV